MNGAERLLKIFEAEQLALVSGVAEIAYAFRKRDAEAFRRAFQKVRPWWPDNRRFTPCKIEDDWPAAQGTYSTLINKFIQNARLILWRRENEHRLLPALYCPDLKTAFFVMTAMGKVRVCPKCNEMFIPSADNVEYCKPAHGIAYRTARSRWNKKERQEEKKKKKKKKTAAKATLSKRNAR
jgi:hypothetical protein